MSTKDIFIEKCTAWAKMSHSFSIIKTINENNDIRFTFIIFLKIQNVRGVISYTHYITKKGKFDKNVIYYNYPDKRHTVNSQR